MRRWALVGLCFAGAALAQGAGVIPPGREPIVLAMLCEEGAADGCACDGVEIRQDHIHARYRCGDGAPRWVELWARSTGAALRTEKFAILSDRNEATDPLVARVAAAVRRLEPEWTWVPLHSDGKPDLAVRLPWTRLGLATVLLLAAVAIWLDRRARQPQGAPPGAWPWAQWAGAVMVGVAAFLVLHWTRVPAPIHLDTARDLLTARDLAAGHDVLPGVPSGYPYLRLTHGNLWLRFLAAGFGSGASLQGLVNAVDAVQALGVALVFLACTRVMSAGATLVATAATLAAVPWVADAPVFWNPALAPLPLALMLLAVVQVARGGGWAWTAVAFASLGAATQLHIVTVALAPALLAVLAATTRRPWVALPMAAGAFVAAAAAPGADAIFAAHAGALLSFGWKAGLGFAVALAAGLAARPFAARAPVERRSFAVLVFLGTCGVLLTVAAQRVSDGPSWRYALPAFPAALVAAALLVEAALRRAPALAGRILYPAVVLAGVLLALRDQPVDEAGWSLQDAERVAAALHARGWSAADVYPRLRSPERPRGLLGSILATYPKAGLDAPASGLGDDVLVLKARADAVTGVDPAWQRVELGGGYVAIIRALPRTLRWSDYAACVLREDPGPRCHQGHIEAPPAGRYHLWSYPNGGHTQPLKLGPDKRTVETTIAFALGPGERRVLQTPGPDNPWRIRRVEGAAIEGTLPGAEVVLGPGPAEGQVVFSSDRRPHDTNWAADWAPDFVESAPQEAALRALLVRRARDAEPQPR